MRIRDLLDDGKPEPAAAGRAAAGGVEAEEGIEHRDARALGDAGAVIVHKDPAFTVAPQADNAMGRAGARVVRQVTEQPTHGPRCGTDPSGRAANFDARA